MDAELGAQDVPPALARRFGVADPDAFWPAWTRAEVAAKLADVPILAWLQRHELDLWPQACRSGQSAPKARCSGSGRSTDVAIDTRHTIRRLGLVISLGIAPR